MLKDRSLTQSVMLLCFGVSLVLSLALQLASTTPTPQPSTKQMPLASQQTSSSDANGSRLVVDLSDRRVYFYQAGKLKANYAIAVGQPGWETPTGSFKVMQMSRNPVWRQPITGDIVASGRDNPLGDRWIGFSFKGANQIGFHGTNKEHLLGQAVSHGCLRMRNQDIRALYEQVSMGTQVSVRR